MKYFETLKEAKAIDDHRVAVTFSKGRNGVFDCRPYFGIGYYRKLNDPAFFKCAFVSCGDLAWPGDIDIGADDVWDEAIPAPKTARRKVKTAARLMDAALAHPERPKARPIFKVRPGRLVERTSTAVFPLDPPWFAKALSYIETHMSSPISTADAARAADVSQTALQNAFHAQFGMSAGKYIRGVKMREADRLLHDGTLSVKEIAARTGFVSHPHFSRTYHDHFGHPPTRQLCQ